MNAVARMSAVPFAVLESRAVATKELLQVSNRARFHAEAALVAALVAGFWVVPVVMSMGYDADWEALAKVGRDSFLTLAITACIVLSLVSLVASSGIILSEITGKRLDLLRVTSLSLETVTLGKGLAVMGRAMVALLLLMPIMAAAQLVGGVAASDVLKATAIILADIFALTSIGLAASAGSRLAFLVALRVGAFLGFWLTTSLTASLVWFWSLLPLISVPPANLPASAEAAALSLSPVGVWAAMGASALTWPTLAAYVSVQLATGLVFLWAAPRALSRTVKRMERRTEKLKVKATVAVKEFSFVESLSKKGRRRIATWWSALPGSLVGCQLLQSNLFVVALPVALVIGMAPVYLGNLAGDTRFGAGDSAAMAAAVLSVVVSAAVGIEACCMIAREKARRTAEVLATTPAGGAGMVIWKGEALFGTQAFGIVAALVFMGLSFLSTGAVPWHGIIAAGAFLSFVMLVYAIGVSFSLASRSPLMAVVGAATAIFVSGPLAEYVRTMILGRYYYDYYPYGYYGQRLPDDVAGFALGTFVVLVVSLMALVLRNLCGRAAWPVLSVSLLLALTAADVIAGTGYHGLIGMPHLLMLVNTSTGAMAGRVAAAAALHALIAAVALAGMLFGFDKAFLGADRGERMKLR
jgi:hypothetical protein